MTQIPLTLLLAGHVDHGKSTLAGALLHALNALPEGKEAAVRHSCERRSVPFEWAFVTDALQAERDQNVTIEASQLRFSTPARRYTLIDAPGHTEFLQNMMTGASKADAGLLVIGADTGMEEQSRRHAYLLQLLGISQLVVAVNKMDAADYAQARFTEVAAQAAEYLTAIGLPPAAIVPVSARQSEGLIAPSARMPWHSGPSLLEAIDTLRAPKSLENLPLRLPVQDVYKWDGKRIVAGRIESGRLKMGDVLYFARSAQSATVTSLLLGSTPCTEAVAGQSIGLTLAEPIYVERGMMASHPDTPPTLSSIVKGRIFWLGRQPLTVGKRYTLRLGTREIAAELQAIPTATRPDTLEREENPQEITRGMTAEVRLRTRGMLGLDDFESNPRTGRFVILDGREAAGGGRISLAGLAAAGGSVKSEHIRPEAQAIGIRERANASGHLPAVLWFSGLSGAGKSTLARELERTLFLRGRQVYVLDGDNLRGGLSRDLGFSAADRHENLRRAGEVAALFARAGFIVIAAFISPTEADREAARACAPEWFHTIYVKASLAACEQRDAKGLYALARAGKIQQFTGISAPFEEPQQPDLVIDTEAADIAACVAKLTEYVERNCVAALEEKEWN